ncbi:hypothetical protein TWF281_007518 [Arthrobotrys megalospora]
MADTVAFGNALVGNFFFPTPTVEVNGTSALDLISTSLPEAEGIINAFKDKISLMSSRVKAVGAGALTNFQRRGHSPEEVQIKILAWIDRAVRAKNGLFQLHMKAIEAERFMAQLLDCLQNEGIVDIDDILKRHEIKVSTDDWPTVKEILEFLAWKQKLGELQVPFMKGYQILDEHLRDLRSQLVTQKPLISLQPAAYPREEANLSSATTEAAIPPIASVVPTAGIRPISWVAPIIVGGTPVYGAKTASYAMHNGYTQPAPRAATYGNHADPDVVSGPQQPFEQAYTESMHPSYPWVSNFPWLQSP